MTSAQERGGVKEVSYRYQCFSSLSISISIFLKTSLSIYRYRYFKKGLIYQLSIYQTPQDTIPRKNDYVIYEPPLINMIRHFCWGFLVKSVCPGSLSWMTLFLFNVKIFWQTWMTGPDNYYRKKTHNFWDGDFLSLKVFAPASPEQIDPLFLNVKMIVGHFWSRVFAQDYYRIPQLNDSFPL